MLLFSDLHQESENVQTTMQVLDTCAVHALSLPERSIGFLGDWLNVRYAIPVELLNAIRAKMKAWVASGLRVYVMPGNHDQVDVAGRHALEFMEDIPGVRVFTEPTIDPETGVWLPYRKDVNQIREWIEEHRPSFSPEAVAFLHHGVAGAFMNNGQMAGPADGLRPEDLPFPRVYCGHWHRHQVVQQVVFVGSQWQVKSDEAGQEKFAVRAVPESGRLAGRVYELAPMSVGRKFHKVSSQYTKDELALIQKGDTVSLPPSAPPELVQALTAHGADVRVTPPQQTANVRVSGSLTLREQAMKYVELTAPVEQRDALMAVFDDLRSR